MTVISSHPETDPKWWKEATIYQIYPASFKDSDDDGWGDLPGITSKLGYLKKVGIDAIWICPFYDSPQEDMGYDIADYEKVWPRYGTNEDCFHLIDQAHKLGIKIIVDLVLNHCSAEHEWFKESRASKDSPKRDWFMWRKPKGCTTDGKPIPPNNWRSFFGGSAWEFDEASQEFYLRLFAPGQPDLNWENETTRKAIYDSAVGYWLDHGVDGFRIDVGSMYSKVTGLPDAPVTEPGLPYQDGTQFFVNGPRIHEFHKEMHQYILDKVTDGREIMTVGEVGFGQESVFREYTSAREGEINMLFNFKHTSVGTGPFKYDLVPFSLKDWKLALAESFLFINGTDCWATTYIENHDQPRSVSRFGNDSPRWRKVSAKLLALMEISFTGTLYVYQGQELGQTNFKNWSIDQYEDIECTGNYKMIKEKYGENSQEIKNFMKGAALISRDHARTPFPWTKDEPFAGFTGAKKPWFSMNESFREGINAETEEEDPNSVLNFWKKALQVRKEHKDVMVYGYDFEFIDLDNDKLFMYTKKNGDKKLFAALNFSDEELEFPVPDKDAEYSLIFGNYDCADGAVRTLKPWEGKLYYMN